MTIIDNRQPFRKTVMEPAQAPSETVEAASAKLASVSPEAVDTRSDILTEAERLFRTYGYSKTTVADIAKACRMSPANVYRFFSSKADINQAICERIIAADEQAALAIARLPLSGAERLKRLIVEMNRRSLENLLDHQKVHEMVMVALEERWEPIQAHVRRITELIAGLIEEGIAAGEFRPQNVNRAAQCVRMAMAPLRHPVLLAQCLGDAERAQPEEMADFVIAALR
jgi:AcrR family transcriptional regulator